MVVPELIEIHDRLVADGVLRPEVVRCTDPETAAERLRESLSGWLAKESEVRTALHVLELSEAAEAAHRAEMLEFDRALLEGFLILAHKPTPSPEA